MKWLATSVVFVILLSGILAVACTWPQQCLGVAAAVYVLDKVTS